MIYLDHAATSWPKPPEVLQAMVDFLQRAGGNPGRSGHRLSIAAARTIYETREAVATLFGTPDPTRVLFTLNATEAINLVLRGLLRAGDRVVTTSMEHNAVMRPLRAMERTLGIELVVVNGDGSGRVTPAQFEAAITPGTRLVVTCHSSNVTGGITPVAQVASLAHRVGARVLIDAAQSAGAVPIDVEAIGIDFLAFSGHKGLYGPPGTGGLVLGSSVDPAELDPLVRGGTGSRSQSQEQPLELPDRYESGTPNGAGLAGLGAGVRLVLRHGVGALAAREAQLRAALVEGLHQIPGVKVYGPAEASPTTGVVSFTVSGRRVSEVALRLDEEHGVLCRPGLHCAPAAHETIGSYPEGTIRFAPGPFLELDDIRRALAAVAAIARAS